MRKGTLLGRLLPTQLDSRLMLAFHSGIVLSLIFILAVYLPYNFKTSADDGTMCSFCSARLGAAYGSNRRGNAKLRGILSTNVPAGGRQGFRTEWESPGVSEATENERVGEEAFGEAPRRFTPMGTSSFLFCLFGAYRTGPNSFGVIGLGNKQQHLNSNPGFECSWVQNPPSDSVSSASQVINGTATKFKMADQYFVEEIEYVAVMVHCTFESPVGIDGGGGELKMIANHGKSPKHTGLQAVEFVAMVEQPGDYNETVFEAPFKYDYLYCGAPLFGSLSPHRVREWIAYHMRLFGPNSYFIFYDAGGIGDEVWRVLERWVKLGRVTIMNIRQQERYSAHYRNQFVTSNDCLLRAKTLAKWTFFFDIDEYLHVSEAAHLESSFHEVMSEMAQRGRAATSVKFSQRPMSFDHCVQSDSDPTLQRRQWAIEKLPFRRYVNTSSDWAAWTTSTHWQDVKYAFQAQYVQGVSIHSVEHVQEPPGMTLEDTITHMDLFYEGCGNCVADKLHYYHYREALTVPDAELCKEFVDPLNTRVEIDGVSHEYDNTMSLLADIVKKFELATIGQVSLDSIQ